MPATPAAKRRAPDDAAPPTELQRRAEEAYELCGVSADGARAAALAVIAAADDDPAAKVTAMRALTLAVRRLDGPRAALGIIREAIALATRAGLQRRLAECRMTHAAILADMGGIDAALKECDAAGTALRGRDSGRLLAQRALIFSRAGRTEEALADYGRALRLLRAAGDTTFQVRAYLNRANLLAYAGRVAAAERDLVDALALAKAHGMRDFSASAASNLGFVLTRKGDVPAALRLFAEAIEEHDGYTRFHATYDRAEALLAVGLAEEASRSLHAAIDAVDAAGFAVDVAEWQLMAAQASLASGDAQTAISYARKARTEFRKQGRPRWALLAQHLEIRARWTEGERTARLATAARDAHAKLAAAGWQVAALHCLIVAGRVELERGRTQAARGDLAQAARARRSGPADLRAAAWYAEALLRLAGGDTRGATAALKAGLRVVDDHAATLGATDLRVRASGLGVDLAAQGVRIALEAGKPLGVLEWIERFRAGALRRRPVRPPADAKLAADLAELRRVTAELAHATAAGSDSRVLRAQQVRLEEAVRSRSRHASGRRGPAVEIDVDRLVAALDDRALVEIFRADDDMFCVTAVDGRLRIAPLGSYGQALDELESLRFSLHRIARRHGSAASLAAARGALSVAAKHLDDLLLGPVLSVVGDRDVVLVPTGRLHALPWPSLPSLRGRPVTVAPSATTWLAATEASRRPRRAAGGAVLVAGPDLEHAVPEVKALAKLYEHPTVLTGPKATADAVRTAMDGAELVHLAAHGRFRADNAQFSALDLADGPLTVYDLERVRRAPRRMVLSACDSGLSAIHPGDELMGLVGAVFSMGTSTLIASVVPVDDVETKDLMTQVHERLCAGAAPAHALAAASAAAGIDGFVCFGAS
jgi:tetratricopeptide (TPR) repeat protein